MKFHTFTTIDQLNSEEAFDAYAVMVEGGPPRVAVSRSDGVNFWQEPGYEEDYDSETFYKIVVEAGSPPVFVELNAPESAWNV